MSLKSELKKWAPNITIGVWVQALPLSIMIGMLWVTAQSSLDLFPNTVKFWEYVVYGWMYGLIGYWIGLVICVRYLRARWLAILFAWFYLFLYAVNSGFLHSAGVVLMRFYLKIADTTDWTAYFTGWMWMLTGIFLFSGVLASWLVHRYSPALQQVRVRSLVLLLILLWAAVQLSKYNYVHPSSIIANAIGKKQAGAWQVTQTETLRMVANNPMMILERAVFTRWQPLQVRPASDLAAMSDTIKAWHLTLGPRQYPALGLKPFNHIIVFATESLSLDFLSPFNTNLPPELTPFYGSSEITQAMYVDYKAIGLPTQPGLAVTYNSHPNIRALLVGNDELSLAKVMDANGYDTYVLLPGSETFLNNRTYFTKMGFHHVLGLEHWEQDPKLMPFIEGRGLMDRALYDQALKLLSENRDRKVYIHVANGDTHGPLPRDDYGSLEYPPTPQSVQRLARNGDANATAILTGIFRHDYDLGLTVHRLKEMNLLTDDTLVVLTADHNFPPTKALQYIPGYPGSFFCRIPLAFLSGQSLPAPWRNEPGSQLDFAPTMAHLLNLPVQPGWWGDSLYTTNQISPYIVRFNDKLSIGVEPGIIDSTFSFDHPANQLESNLLDLFKTAYVEEAPTKVSAPPRIVAQ
jgi:hypothetical protein